VKVLQVIPQLEVGGAERVVLDLVAGLQADGHRLLVAAGPGALDDDPALEGVERVVLRERGRSALGVLDAAAAIARLARRRAPDVVHAHGVRATATVALALPAAGRGATPLVATFHGVVPGEYRASARVVRRCDHVATVSADVARALVEAGLPESRTSVVPNGMVPPPAPTAAQRAAARGELRDGDGPLAIAVGRLVPEKAYDRLLEAWAGVLRERPAARLALVGDGPLRAELERQAMRLGLGDGVRFLGLRRDARALVAAADLLVFSSVSEGMSIAALEAMAAGVPVVSTPVTGMAELLATGAGLLVEDHEPATLARGLVRVLDDEEGRRAMGATGQRLVDERFSAARMVADYERLYARVAAARASR
jgi:glycosyltransferase involved in cell wall biosynthesis